MNINELIASIKEIENGIWFPCESCEKVIYLESDAHTVKCPCGEEYLAWKVIYATIFAEFLKQPSIYSTCSECGKTKRLIKWIKDKDEFKGLCVECFKNLFFKEGENGNS